MDTPTCSIPRDADTGVRVESAGGVRCTGLDPATVVGLIAGFRSAGLDGNSLLTLMTGMEQIAAAAYAVQAQAMAEFTLVRPSTPGRVFGEFVADEIAVELCLTRRAAENRVAQAVEMTTRVPAVLHALQTGVVDLHRAGVITDATHGLDDDTATHVANHVVEQVEGRNENHDPP